MRNYETIIVFSSVLDENELTAEIAKAQSLLESHGAKNVQQEKWGRKEIAYAVKKQKFGNYVVFTYESDQSETVDKTSRVLAIKDSVLKFQTHVLNTKRKKVRSSAKADSQIDNETNEALLADVEY